MSWNKSLGAANQGAVALNLKVIDIAERNSSTGFDLAMSLAGAKNVAEAVEMQSAYWRKQLGAAVDLERPRPNRKDDIVVTFVRTGEGLSLELQSPNWKLEDGKHYPVKMTLGPLTIDTEVAARPNSVSTEIKDEKFAAGLRSASALNVTTAGATIRVPLDKSEVAFDRLEKCVEKNNRTDQTNPFAAPARQP